MQHPGEAERDGVVGIDRRAGVRPTRQPARGEQDRDGHRELDIRDEVLVDVELRPPGGSHPGAEVRLPGGFELEPQLVAALGQRIRRGDPVDFPAQVVVRVVQPLVADVERVPAGVGALAQQHPLRAACRDLTSAVMLGGRLSTRGATEKGTVSVPGQNV